MTETAKIYGGSLYDLAAEENRTEEIYEQMKEIQDLFRENPDYLRLLGEPSIPRKERLGLIETAFGSQAERYLVNFIKLLCEKNLLGEYSMCCEEFTHRYYADHGIAEAIVTTAAALREEQKTSLQKKLEAISGKHVILKEKTDASVIGGIRVELEGKLLDGTVQGRLSGISRRLQETVV